MTIALKLVVSCETLDFNHAFSKTCQNATMDEFFLLRLEIRIYQVYKRGLAKVYNLTQEIWEK